MKLFVISNFSSSNSVFHCRLQQSGTLLLLFSNGLSSAVSTNTFWKLCILCLTLFGSSLQHCCLLQIARLVEVGRSYMNGGIQLHTMTTDPRYVSILSIFLYSYFFPYSLVAYLPANQTKYMTFAFLYLYISAAIGLHVPWFGAHRR